jgi:hypothetical protein
MSEVYEANTIARVLLTVAALGFSALPMYADFNKTHATNPLWTGHARFHVVWQVLSYAGVGTLSLYLIWTNGPAYLSQLRLACILPAVVYGAFFTTYFSMRLFGGRAHDDNGYLPIPVRLFGARLSLDLNFTVFGVLVLLLIVAIASIRVPVAG